MFPEHVHSSRVLAFSYSTVYQSSARARIFVYERQTLYRGCFLDKVVSPWPQSGVEALSFLFSMSRCRGPLQPRALQYILSVHLL